METNTHEAILSDNWLVLTIGKGCYNLSIRRDERRKGGTIALFFGSQMVSVRRFRKSSDILKIADNMINRYIEKKGYYRYLKLYKIAYAMDPDKPLKELESEDLYSQFLKTEYVEYLRYIQEQLNESFRVF